MTGEETPAVDAYQVMVRRYLEPRVAALPTDRDGYLRGPLDLHQDFTDRGHPNPVAALGAAMAARTDITRDILNGAGAKAN